MNCFLDSNFFSALFGAIGGSFTTSLIEWYRGQGRFLTDINSTICQLEFYLKLMVDLKKNHASPLKKAFDENKKLYEAGKDYELSIKSYLYILLPFVPGERLSSCVEVSALKDILKVQPLLHQVNNMYDLWNKTCKEFEDFPEQEKSKKFFGASKEHLHTPKDGTQPTHKIDERIPQQIEGLLSTLDDALHFIYLSLKGLEKSKKTALWSLWHRKKVITVHLNEEELKWIPDRVKELGNNA